MIINKPKNLFNLRENKITLELKLLLWRKVSAGAAMFAQTECFPSRYVNNHISGNMSTVFVTVGTTSFDDLIVSLTSRDVVEVANVERILAFTYLINTKQRNDD